MRGLLPVLFLLFLAAAARAQCGYPVSIHTNKDYCLGSSLAVSSTHALERIVWYKDGQPVDSALARQHLNTTPQKIQIKGVWPTNDICSDGVGNVYFFDGHRERIVGWNPVTGNVTYVGSEPPNDSYDRLFASSQGDVYAINPQFQSVVKYPAGSRDSVIVATTGQQNLSGVGGLAADCQGNLYVGYQSQNAVFKWAPGAASGTIAAGGNGYGTAPDQIPYLQQMALDSLDNLMLLEVSSLVEWPSGASSGTTLIDLNSLPGIAGPTDFWMDGKDTCYFVGWSAMGSNNIPIGKWAPGMASPQPVVSFPFPKEGSGPPQLTVDINGNIFVVCGTDSALYEFKRTTAIDSAYTPTATGIYYAVVTDLHGYAVMSNKVAINTPSSGTPSISISATATSAAVCTPITFTAAPVDPGPVPAYQWMVSGVKVGDGSLTYANNLFADSDQVYCIMTAAAGCQGLVLDTSNIILLHIDPHGTASVKISASKDSLCTGDSVLFTAVVMNGSAHPAYQWLLNGVPTSDDSSTYGGGSFSNGNVVTALITSDDACGLAKSNSIALTVSTPPSIESGQVVTILHGHSETLEPVITGDADVFLWTPGIGLSDSTIENPVASPDTNTLYTLSVKAPGGCAASGTILVNVYTPLSMPNAFTPNGDGHNDRLYVLGGPINSVVESFAVFNRWGQAVFQVHDAAPGDAAAGWDGRVQGAAAAVGTYVYMVVLRTGDGRRQVYKGTVELIR